MRTHVLAVSALLLGLACQHAATPDDLYGRVKSPVGTSAPEAKSAAPKSCGHDWECGDGYLCLKSQCVPISEQLAECSTARVHFDFDQSTMHPDEHSSLERIARCLKADRKMHIVIDGNTDERGTLEYNLALGDKRARVVEVYLKNLGVSEQQMSTVTYGKDRPLCEEHDEKCWSENRRATAQAKR